jgi:hypothetical protein
MPAVRRINALLYRRLQRFENIWKAKVLVIVAVILVLLFQKEETFMCP